LSIVTNRLVRPTTARFRTPTAAMTAPAIELVFGCNRNEQVCDSELFLSRSDDVISQVATRTCAVVGAFGRGSNSAAGDFRRAGDVSVYPGTY
jgi:hypothetical protein